MADVNISIEIDPDEVALWIAKNTDVAISLIGGNDGVCFVSGFLDDIISGVMATATPVATGGDLIEVKRG